MVVPIPRLEGQDIRVVDRGRQGGGGVEPLVERGAEGGVELHHVQGVPRQEARDELMRRPIELPYHKYLYEFLNLDERSWQVGNQIVKHLETKGVNTGATPPATCQI